MKIYYQNNYGQIVDFMVWPYRISESDLLDYQWEYESRSNSTVFGGKITRFQKTMVEKAIKLSIGANNAKQYNQALKNFLEVVEKDILNLTPGKLYVGEQYLSCYIYASKKTEFQGMHEFLINDIQLVSEYPAWCKEMKYQFSGDTGIETPDYPYDYPYDYSSAYHAGNVVNEHYGPCGFELIIYGPCVNPRLYIGGHLYHVEVTIKAGEHLKIDGRKRTIVLFKPYGRQENVFHLRDKEFDVFRPIPVGKNPVVHEGTLKFDLILFQERSEPEWILS